MTHAKNVRRLRRAFLYRFVLRFRFWLQREANTQKQRRSSNAISAQTFAVNLKNFAPAALFLQFLEEPRRRRNAAARSAPQPPPANLKNSRHERCAASGSGDVAVPTVRSERFRRDCFSCAPSGAQRIIQSRTGSCHRFALNRP